MPISLGIISVKGGVGKTTVASSLACDLVNSYGKRVLLIDANYSAPNLARHMDVNEVGKTVHDVLAGNSRIEHAVHTKYGVDVIPGHADYESSVPVLKLKERIAKFKNKYDYVVIDSSPHPGDEMMSTILASDALFMVSTPDLPTLDCSLKAAKLAKQKGVSIAGIILNKMRDKNFELSIKEIEKSTGIPVVAALPDDKKHVRALSGRIPMSLYDVKGKFSKELHALNDALIGIKEEPKWYQKLFKMDLSAPEANREVLQHSFYKSVFGYE